MALDQGTWLGSGEEVRGWFEDLLAMNAEIPLRWTPEFGGTSTLSIEVRAWGPFATVDAGTVLSGGGSGLRRICAKVMVPATLHLTTADGLLDETIEGDFVASTAKTWPAAGLVRQWIGAHDTAATQDSAIGEQLSTTFGGPDLDLRSFNAIVYTHASGDDGPAISGELWAISGATDAVADPLGHLAQLTSAWPQDGSIREP